MDLAEQLRWTQIGLTLAFCAVLILVCGWLAEDKVVDALTDRKVRREPAVICPLHKTPRTDCQKYHEE